ncbi:RNA-directed DNA polymerase [Mesoflavibacter zeaxanthinifaciens]
MGLTYEELKNCSVKITANIAGVPVTGSGIVYQTPNLYSYNYVITAKHILSEDSNTPFQTEKVNSIRVEYFSNKKFEQLVYLKYSEIKNDINFIIFESEDLAIIKIDKKEGVTFPSILVTDQLENDELKFSSWSIFKANERSLDHFMFDRSDPSLKRVKLNSKVTKDYLDGLSGSGVFVHNKNILYGIVSKYPNENFENATIECSDISFEKINLKLSSLNLLKLDDKANFLKRELDGKIVEIYQAQINDTFLNLDLALKRVKTDMFDDWFYDSLQYVDLLTSDYLFCQFKEHFYNNTYKTCRAEKFFVPKSNFTLREAYILPLIDRIIYMAIAGELSEVIDNSIISNVFASRLNKTNENNLLVNGVEQWIKLRYKISEELHEKNVDGTFKYNCILHVDILNYYDNIDKHLLVEKLKRIAVNDNQLKSIDLLKNFLDKFSEKRSGLPQNNDSSALLATFYLNQVDVFMQNHTQTYYRFVDDIKILCSDKYEARRYLILLEKELKRCHLSVNSQKTKIIEITENNKRLPTSENIKQRSDYHRIFNSELERIKVYYKSSNYNNRNEAFHSSIKLLNESINMDENENDEQAQKLRFTLNIIEKLGKSNIHFLTNDSEFYKALKKAVSTLKDKPWITHQICRILALVKGEEFESHFLEEFKSLVLDKKYNLYPYQQFQIWLLLAKHKINDKVLIQFASKQIEINNKTQTATTAAQILYLSTVDKNFKRILLRKMGENFTDGYFQNRAALVALRSFNLVEPSRESIHESLKDSFQYTSKFGEKDLVHYHDLDISDNESDLIDQLFSI